MKAFYVTKCWLIWAEWLLPAMLKGLILNPTLYFPWYLDSGDSIHTTWFQEPHPIMDAWTHNLRDSRIALSKHRNPEQLSMASARQVGCIWVFKLRKQRARAGTGSTCWSELFSPSPLAATDKWGKCSRQKPSLLSQTDLEVSQGLQRSQKSSCMGRKWLQVSLGERPIQNLQWCPWRELVAPSLTR